MEDLDRERVIEGCAARQLRTLEQFALGWDGPVEYQSARTAHYAEALARLEMAGLTFPCTCSRRELAGEPGYPGTCRAAPRSAGAAAVRFRVSDTEVRFADRIQGECRFGLGRLGDVVIRRRDGAFAYQLAVVVDDALQHVTDVVRGADLLDSTPWQIALQHALGYPTPRYAHLPLVVEPGGSKLAKARRSVALEPGRAGAQLTQVLQLLGLNPPDGLEADPPEKIMNWAVAHASFAAVRGMRTVVATD